MASEDSSNVPLIPKEEKEGEEVTATQAMEEPVVVKKRSFVYRRVTYYWILVVSQFFQAALCIAAFAISVAERKKGVEKDGKDVKDRKDLETSNLLSGMYSMLTLLYGLIILVSHYNGTKTKINAGKHVALGRCIVFLSALNFSFFFIPVVVAYARGQISNEIERLFVPAVFILFWVSSLAALVASRITKKAAERVHGNAMVNDPAYRVEAWTLAMTVDEVEGGIRLA